MSHILNNKINVSNIVDNESNSKCESIEFVYTNDLKDYVAGDVYWVKFQKSPYWPARVCFIIIQEF